MFSVHQAEYDSEYILCSLGFAQRLFEKEGCATALEIKLTDSGKRDNIEKLLGGTFKVQDRYEQQEDVFRIMQIEKLISFAFLCFILFVACLNIMGSLSMLKIEKRDDIQTLSAIGSTTKQIRSIFALEGLMIILGGALFGMIIAIAMCLLQQHYGLIRMGQGEGSFIIDAYPVVVRTMDMLTIFIAVVLLGGVSVLFAARK